MTDQRIRAESRAKPNGSCRRCGWPDTEPYETLSRHVTSTGMIVYTRCACGLLQVRSYPFAGSRARRRPTGLIARADCPAT